MAEARAADLTRTDRFGLILVFVVTIVAFLLGLALRQSTINQAWTYANRQAGIEAAYPATWLVDEDGPYVARIRDPKARPFKTQFMLTTVAASGQTSVRNVLDDLTLQRSTQLAAYRVLSVEEVNVGGATLTEMRFAFVDSDPNPFIQRLPVVVLGRDVVIIDGDRAIVATFMADEDTFAEELPSFERFLASLQY